MKIRFLILFVIQLFILIFPGEDIFGGKCVGVIDGDTISVMRNGEAVKIRLEGIDCPEKRQDFGAKAKKFTAERVFGKNVKISVKTIDVYGRIVGRVYVNDLDLSLELIKNGLAWHYKKYNKDTLLALAEKEARDNKIGLWAMRNPVPPWEFRKNN